MKPLRLAMWSGPRNISTAMMRAWENRGDCVVIDEPLYAHYLAQTGLDHPGRETVIAAGETDWRKVAARLVGPVPEGKPVWYQKHMTHHLLPHMGREWLGALTHAFLIPTHARCFCLTSGADRVSRRRTSASCSKWRSSRTCSACRAAHHR